MADFREFLQEGTFPERKALIRNFVEGIEVVGDEATLTYTIPMPSDGVTSESASVLDFVQSGPLTGVRTTRGPMNCCPSQPALGPPPTSTVVFRVDCLSSMLPTTISSKRRALSLGVSQASLPCFMMDWQT